MGFLYLGIVIARASLRIGVLACAATALLAFTGATGASTPLQETPFAVTSVSLIQQGRELRWSVSLDHSFDGLGLKRQNRSLCLLIEPAKSGSSELCVAPPPAKGRPLRLRLLRLTGTGEPLGSPRTISATIARPNERTLVASFLPESVGLRYKSFHWQVRSGFASSSTLYPAQPALARLHTPMVVGCVASGSSLVYEGSPKSHEIALSFDDGPWDDPPSIDFVNLLARYHVPATFFEIGDEISEYDPSGAVERRMLADGDMIGDHTWTHPDMVMLSPSEQRSQLELTADAIRRATGFTPCLWRPPYGDISDQLDSLARSLGFLTIDWDIDPRDWSLPGVAEIENNVLTNARDGAIVEMHFGGGPRQETLSALPTIITTLRKRGYKFVNIAEMLGLKMMYK